MKYLIIIVLFLSACQKPKPRKNLKQASIQEQPISDAEKQIAKDLIQGAFDDLWGGVDSTKISKYHTDDFVILEQGEIWDNNRIKAYMRGQLARKNRAKRINKMKYISIEKYGKSMQIAYHNFAEFKRADSLVGKAQWLESALAVKTKDGWKLKMMHSTGVRKKKK